MLDRYRMSGEEADFTPIYTLHAGALQNLPNGPEWSDINFLAFLANAKILDRSLSPDVVYIPANLDAIVFSTLNKAVMSGLECGCFFKSSSHWGKEKTLSASNFLTTGSDIGVEIPVRLKIFEKLALVLTGQVYNNPPSYDALKRMFIHYKDRSAALAMLFVSDELDYLFIKTSPEGINSGIYLTRYINRLENNLGEFYREKGLIGGDGRVLEEKLIEMLDDQLKFLAGVCKSSSVRMLLRKKDELAFKNLFQADFRQGIINSE